MNSTRGRQTERARAWTIALLIAAMSVPPSRPAAAQADTGTTSWLVAFSEYGKWAALAGAAGLTTVAILRNRDADEIFEGLTTLCRSAPSECVRRDDGTYEGSDAERLYQETVRLDRQARSWMIGGQIALAAAGTMFLIDLVTGDQGPKNIPFTPLEVYSASRRVGVRYRF